MKLLWKKLERFLGTNLDYIVRGGFWLGLDQVAAVLIGIVMSLAFANLISQQTLGLYRYVLTYFSILTIFTLPNMSKAVIIWVGKGFEGLFIQAVKHRVRWGLVGSAVGILTASYYFITHNSLLGSSFLIMAVFIPLVDPQNLYNAYLKGKKLFKVASQYSIVVRIISAGSLIITMFLTKDLFLILLAFFVPYVVMHRILLSATLKKFPPNQEQDSQMLVYGKHLTVLQAFKVGINSLDNLLIFHFLGAAPLAVYSIAMSPISKIRQAFSIIPGIALPKFSGRPAAETKRTLLKKIFKSLIFIGAGVAIYIIAAPTIFNLLLPRYIEAVPFTRWLALTSLSLPFGLLYTFFESQAMKDKLYKHGISYSIVQLILVIALVPSYGIAGAVFARLLAQVFSVILLLLFFNRLKT